MIVLILGLGLLAVGCLLIFREHRWLGRANITEGTVTELIAKRGNKGGVTYQPRVKYKTPDGQEFTFTRGYASSPPGFKVGERVLVAYEAASQDARILTFGQRFGAGFIISLIGVGLLLGFVGFRVGRVLVPQIYTQRDMPPVRR